MSEDQSANRTQRNKIIIKVQALMSKTVDAGCTEAEAMEAAVKASELMSAYDLSYVDVEAEVAEDIYGARTRPLHNSETRKRQQHEITYCLRTIAEYWDCRTWTQGQKLTFFGEKHDTENAHAMTVLLHIAMDHEWGRYLNSPSRPTHVHGKTLRTSFMMGMVTRLCERLRDLKAARTQASAPETGTALVVVKARTTAEKFNIYAKDNNINIRTSRGGASASSSAAYFAGKHAAGIVDLGSGKIGGRSPLLK